MGCEPGKQPWAVADRGLGVEVLADRLQLSRSVAREVGRHHEIGDAFTLEEPVGHWIRFSGWKMCTSST